MRERERERLIASAGVLLTDLDLLGCGTPTATLASEIQPAEKGRMTSLSILCLIFFFLREEDQLELLFQQAKMQP